MEHTSQVSSSDVQKKTYVFLNQLEVGKEAEVLVMICRTWDTHTSYGKFLSTDVIASDEHGNVIQLTAKNNVAHHFIPRLKEGNVYFLKDFDVIPNKEEYRILKDNKVIIQLHGGTFMKKQGTADMSLFTRHPFTCIDFGDLQPTDGKYLVDVIGCVANVGTPQPTKTGALTLEFDLVNERGRAIRPTLWGNMGPTFVEKLPSATTLYCIIVTSVIVKKGYTGALSIL